ncbi:hypothetical protein CWO92_19550 [Heyndrickxia camelliae]|uniref:Uncharacterized protein n=1 Tax=Heyndrickxia camelliae TaxID=1707093 RepID=A0A2N3LFI2_9BACI|nr:hypothetical protein CWO92_19550 [Heyndrickxia camelliae]
MGINFLKKKEKNNLVRTIFLIFTPIIFFITAILINPFAPYGFGKGIISVLHAFSFLVNIYFPWPF